MAQLPAAIVTEKESRHLFPFKYLFPQTCQYIWIIDKIAICTLTVINNETFRYT